MEITPEVLGELERRYLPASEQKCVVCGAPLAFSASGERGGSRYNCSSDEASPVRSPLSFRERILHYERSAWIDRGEASPWVVALVRAYRVLQEGGDSARSRLAARSHLAALRAEVDGMTAGAIAEAIDRRMDELNSPEAL